MSVERVRKRTAVSSSDLRISRAKRGTLKNSCVVEGPARVASRRKCIVLCTTGVDGFGLVSDY